MSKCLSYTFLLFFIDHLIISISSPILLPSFWWCRFDANHCYTMLHTSRQNNNVFFLSTQRNRVFPLTWCSPPRLLDVDGLGISLHTFFTWRYLTKQHIRGSSCVTNTTSYASIMNEDTNNIGSLPHNIHVKNEINFLHAFYPPWLLFHDADAAALARL